MKIFAEKSLQDYLQQTQSSVIQSIENESDSFFLDIVEKDYLKQKSLEVYIEPITIQTDKLHISLSEQMVPAEKFPSIFSVEKGKSYKKEVIKFHIPYTGNTGLFECYPKKRTDWTMEIELAEEEICFEIINFSNNTNGMNNEKDSNLKNIEKQLENITAEVIQYNSEVTLHIQQAISTRKKA